MIRFLLKFTFVAIFNINNLDPYIVKLNEVIPKNKEFCVDANKPPLLIKVNISNPDKSFLIVLCKVPPRVRYVFGVG